MTSRPPPYVQSVTDRPEVYSGQNGMSRKGAKLIRTVQRVHQEFGDVVARKTDSWVDAALAEPNVDLRNVAASVADAAVFGASEAIADQGVNGKLSSCEIDVLHQVIEEIVLGKLREMLASRSGSFNPCLYFAPCSGDEKPKSHRLLMTHHLAPTHPDDAVVDEETPA